MNNVYLALRQPSFAAIPSFPAIVILPDEDKWNDYSLRLYAVAAIYFNDREVVKYSIRMQVKDEAVTEFWLKKRVVTEDAMIPLAECGTKYITAFLSEKSYFEIGERLGPEVSVQLFQEMHDIPTLRTLYSSASDLELMNERDFHLGFIRTDSAFQICASDIYALLRKVEYDVLEGLRAFWHDVELGQRGNILKIVFDCDESPFGKNRVSVIIGENGIGKTRVLSEIALAVSKKQSVRFSPSSANNEESVAESNSSISTKVKKLTELDFSIPIFITTTRPPQSLLQGILRRTVGAVNDQKINLTRDFIRIFRRTERQAVTASTVLRIIFDTFDGMTVQVPVGESDYKKPPSSFSDKYDLEFSAGINTGRPLRFLDKDGEIKKLSSGEETLFETIVVLASTVERNSIVLMDEPENTLHPRYVSIMMDALQRVLTAYDSFAVIATHSPLIVREVASESVHILAREEGHVQSLRPLLQTLGGSLAVINDMVFGDDSIDKSYYKMIRRAIDLSEDIKSLDNNIATYLGVNGINYYAEVRRPSDAP